MSIKPDSVTHADWAVYKKVQSIMNTIAANKRKTKFPPEHYRAMVNKRWAKKESRQGQKTQEQKPLTQDKS